MSDSLIIIPTYNEKQNIEKIIRKILSLEKFFHILVIEDGSPDGTAIIVKDLQKEFKDSLFIEERSGKLGLGTAYIHGFKWSLANNYDFIFEMDCDFSHNPSDLVRMYESIQRGHDLVIGSRYCKGGRVRNWPLKRILMSYFASVYVRLVLFINIKDTTAGFKCYRSSVLKKIKLDNIPFKGYAFQVCMKYAALKNGFKVKEIPITFVDREFGDSKMSTGIFKEAFFGVFKIRNIDL